MNRCPVGPLVTAVSVLAASTPAPTAAQERTRTVDALLSDELDRGEAILWYLSHAGWAVKTADHFLIFDYAEPDEPPSDPSLSNGYIGPDEIRDQRVLVFVSHGHADHFDPVIFEWRDAIPSIRYVLGWEA